MLGLVGRTRDGNRDPAGDLNRNEVAGTHFRAILEPMWTSCDQLLSTKGLVRIQTLGEPRSVVAVVRRE
jgi:hypothetical protein